jgi:hypothetical protein
VHKTRPTQSKRQRERAQADKRKEKAERRQQSRARRAAVAPPPSGEDPDIAGIRPGPQRSPYVDMIGELAPEADEADVVDEKP